MSHEVEKMMYVGAVPWHGHGKKLEAPPTIHEAIVAAGLDWEVLLKPLIVEETGAKVSAFATVRSSDGRVIGVVGKKYQPIQNLTAFEWFQPWLDSGAVELETAGSLKGGRHVWALARIKRDPVDIVKNDAVLRYILLSNSHDGTRMARGGFTAIRAVCWNTLTAALKDEASKMLRVRHTANAAEALTEIREVMNVADREFVATVDVMRALAKKGVTQKSLVEYVRKVFTPKVIMTTKDAESKTPTCDRILAKVIPLFEKGRGNDLPGVKGTMWGAYNAVTEYLTHERGRNQDNRMTSLWFGDSAQLGPKALRIAMTA